MAPRPLWKGFLKLALVACPVALYPAFSATARVSFNTLNRATGNRLRRQMVDEETGDVVESPDQVRGYPISKDEYVLVEDEDLEAVQLESTHTIDIEAFAPRQQVDERYLDTPYYLIADDKVGAEAFAVIRDAMARKKVVGLAKVVLFRRERLLMLEPRGKGMLATSLHYDYEIRDESDYFDEIPDIVLPKDSVDLAEHIIASKSGKFDPSTFRDRYEEAVVDVIKARQAGKTVRAASRPRGQSNVVDLMEALRRSVKDEGGRRPAPAAPAKPRVAAKKVAAKKKAAPKRRRAG
jgi:DNA end-binding protein Ku